MVHFDLFFASIFTVSNWSLAAFTFPDFVSFYVTLEDFKGLLTKFIYIWKYQLVSASICSCSLQKIDSCSLNRDIGNWNIVSFFIRAFLHLLVISTRHRWYILPTNRTKGKSLRKSFRLLSFMEANGVYVTRLPRIHSPVLFAPTPSKHR